MSDGTVDIDYDEECIFRTSEAAWFLILENHGVYSNKTYGKFFSKKWCTLNEDEKTVTVPVWLAEKMGVV